MGWLKACARPKVPDSDSTEEVSHSPMGWLKACAALNRSAKLVTLLTSHNPMAPYVPTPCPLGTAVAAKSVHNPDASSSMHMLTATCKSSRSSGTNLPSTQLPSCKMYLPPHVPSQSYTVLPSHTPAQSTTAVEPQVLSQPTGSAEPSLSSSGQSHVFVSKSTPSGS